MGLAAYKKFSRFLLVFAIIAFYSVAFFGASKSMMGMDHRDDGSMGGCLFIGIEEICKMTFAEHFAEWQSMFTATVAKNTLTDMLSLLLVLVFVAAAIFKRNRFLLFSYCTVRYRLYTRQNPHLPLFIHLKEAFSQGILNPKIY